MMKPSTESSASRHGQPQCWLRAAPPARGGRRWEADSGGSARCAAGLLLRGGQPRSRASGRRCGEAKAD
eukprot:5930554-Prymnesium_polylepis.1